MATDTVKLEIEIDEEKVLQVDLEINASYGNLGIGPYEYWGFKGNDVKMGWEIDDYEWDYKAYTEEENKLIQKYIDNNEDDIFNKFFKLIDDNDK